MSAAREYEVCVEVLAQCYVTVEAENEDDAVAEALAQWSLTDCQNETVHRVLIERRPGVYDEVVP